MEEKIEFKDKELFIAITEENKNLQVLTDRIQVAECVTKGMPSVYGGRIPARAFTFPGLTEITKSKIKILLQERE